ncbi:invasion associated locus B family protein [Nereida sp. MMG025]|uniref:invasion associated locus B family protein n=1 Tax=Nereida sp. MMG025 TaxID=2909981 RepID=UPI001F2EDDDC|nr:invasion associated locus B family protein [Nereida sp. MMG025]MCF6443198.1 invasion associated locus B family protein [Nereida sp. MMG025]
MSDLLKTLTLVTALGMASPLLAQTTEATETPAPETTEQEAAPAEGSVDDGTGIELQMGEPEQSEPQPGQTYVMEESGDWEIRCVKLPADAEQKDPCQLYQLLSDQQGNAVAEINILSLPAGAQAAAGANIIVPLETLLTERLSMSIDGGQARKYQFAFCSQVGCLARLGFSAADVTAFKRGNAANLTIVPAVAPDQKVELTVSLSGFTAGFDRLAEIAAQ